MNFDFYVLGASRKGYVQYPNDYVATFYREMIKRDLDKRLVVHREDKLTHYIYAENLGDGVALGFSLVLNSLRITKLTAFAGLCHSVLQNMMSSMLSSGKFIVNNEEGVGLSIEDLNHCGAEIHQAMEELDRELTPNKLKYAVAPNARRSGYDNEIVTTHWRASDSEILALTEAHSTVIINFSWDGDVNDLTGLVAYLRDENAAYKETIEAQQKELLKRKRHTWVILILSFVMIAATGVGWYATDLAMEKDVVIRNKIFEIEKLQGELKCAKDEISRQNDTIDMKSEMIREKEHNIDLLIKEVDFSDKEIERLNQEVDNLNDRIDGLKRLIYHHR